MASDLTGRLRDTTGNVAREALKNLGDGGGSRRRLPTRKKSSPLSGAKGVAAGAGLAALVPLAKKGVDAARRKGGGPDLVSKVGDTLGDKVKETASQKIDEAGGLGGIAKQAAGGVLSGGLFGGGGGGGGGGGLPGVGKGRRMPVQQSVDVAVPIETAYNQFTQFEDWPEFMHRVTRLTQEEDNEVSFATKIWTRTRALNAESETQRPNERIMWKVSQGITHTGVVTFHELAPGLTRIELNMDVAPGGMIEKLARGMRNVKRAARADLHRYKAFIEMQELETGAWRGVIEEGEVVEEHPEDYDSEREYSDIEDIRAEAEAEAEEDEEQDEEELEEQEEEEREAVGAR